MRNAIQMIILISFLIGMIGCTKKQNENEKVLNLYHDAKVKGVDPIYADDRYSAIEVARIYEGLLEFHYLKRPYTLQSNLATSLPQVSADGLTYTFTIQKNVLFHDNKCFPKGKGRELVADDFVYSIKRIADPQLQSGGWWLLDGKIKGLNEWREKNSKATKVDYDQEVEGLKAIDRYTIQFKLAKPFPQFLYTLAMPYTFAVPKEGVEYYGKTFINNPIGTGAFILPEFEQTNKIVYTKNPKFRDKFYPTSGADGDKERGLLDSAGKKLPLVDKIIVNIMPENQTRWLNFQKGNLDYLGIPKDNFETAVTPDNQLTDQLAIKGIQLEVVPSLDITYTAFNHEDNLFKNNLKLRQAMSLAYDTDESNKLFYGGRALKAQSIIPPGIAGYIPEFKNPYREFNISKAKKLLAEAGYPDGKGLPEINFEITASSSARQMGEYFQRSMNKIGINIKINTNTWPELTKKVNTRQAQMFGMAWGADYPDAENFLQLLYSKNRAPGSNGSNYSNPTYDALYEQASLMQDSPERTALYEKLNKLAADNVPLIYGVHRMSFQMKHSWLKNFKFTEFEQNREIYLDIDLKTKKEMIKKL